MEKKKTKTTKIIIIILILILFFYAIISTLFIVNVNSADCYIGNYDEYICYNGEIFYKICDENKELFSEDFYDNYEDFSVSNLEDLNERSISVKGINTNIKSITENVLVVYDDSSHNEIVFLQLDHFLDTVCFAKRQ